MAIFLIVVLLLSSLKESNQQLEARVSERTLKLTAEIHERQRAEEELAKQQEELQVILDSVPAIIFYKDRVNRLARINKAFIETMGLPREELEGKTCFEIWPKNAEAYWADDKEVMASGAPKRNIIEPLKTPKGVRWLQTDKIPYRDRHGEVIGIIGFSIDITERIKVEDELRHAQKMEALGTLAGGLAHDFNNILAGILGYAHLLKEGIGPQSSLNADVDAIGTLGKRGADLVTSLLGFARKGEYHPEPVDIHQIIGEVLDIIRQTAGTGIGIRTEIPPGILNTIGDAGQLHQLLMNLCINACDAMHDGGTLAVRTALVTQGEDFFVRHPGLKKKAYLSITVADTATGMPPEVRQRIFEPFFTTKRDGKGTGLGLSIASGIVEMHGGCIEVASDVGRGSTFTVYLPATGEKAKDVARGQEGSPGEGATVLLVDDEEGIRDSIGRCLKGMGYAVIVARGGEEALEVIGRVKGGIDVVLLDIVMRGMGGEETFARIRKILPDLPIILCTGYSHDRESQRLLEKGASGVLQKPIEPRKLALKIKEVITGRSASV